MAILIYIGINLKTQDKGEKNMNDELATNEDFELDELMTPEEMALYKKLHEKKKAQQKAMNGVKDKLFNTLTGEFGGIISKVKKDVVTVSLKDPYEDGNIYAITFGSEEETEQEIDTQALAKAIIDQNLDAIEPIMGISNSMKVSGSFEGKKLFWQIRKRPA